MLNFDYRNIAEPLRVFLCKPDNSIICELNGIETDGASLKINNNNQYELEFNYYKHINSEEGLVESNGYDSLLIGMKLFLENVGYFKMKYPPYTYDGTKEFKHIAANSVDSELEDKDLVLFKINTGEETSFENLVEYKHSPHYTPNEVSAMNQSQIIVMNGSPSETPTVSAFIEYLVSIYGSVVSNLNRDISFYYGNSTNGYTHLKYIANSQTIALVGETEELLNPYTGVPYDYIVFYNTFKEQLAALKVKYPNNTDSSPITDTTKIAEIKKYCNLIPRLVSKPIKDGTGKIVQSLDSDDNIIYSFDTYVTFNYNSDKSAITSIELTNFHDRIDELCVFYDRENGYGKQLSLIDLAIENCNSLWTIGDIGGSSRITELYGEFGGENDDDIAQEILDIADSSLVNKRCQFDIDGQNIYSFLTQDIAQQSKCIAKFDYINYKINYISVDNLGKDSGVIIDKRNLLNNLGIDVDEDNIVTRYNVSGGNNLNLLDVNFGSNRIVNIDYYLNSRDKNGKRIYVSDELATKYGKYKNDVETARIKYIEVAKEQRQAQKDIDEITYRVPNDIIQNDWGTFKLSELEAAETHYSNLMATLQSLYREDYPEGVNQDDSINELFMRTTPYWHDYYAYQQALTQIGYAQYAINNNTSYKELIDDEIIKAINAWETEWSLFGTKELENKIVAYNNSLNVMLDAKTVLPVLDSSNNPLPRQETTQTLNTHYTYNSTTNKITFGNSYIPKNCVIITIAYSNGTKTVTDAYIGDGVTKVFTLNDTYSSGLTVKIITTDKTILAWSGLNNTQKEQYASESEYTAAYDEYMKILKNRNGCQAYLDYTLQPQLGELQQSYNAVTALLNSIKALVTVKTYNRAGLHNIINSIPNENISFTDSEVAIITNLYVDHNYSNENILITSIDDIVSVIDIEQELLEDAKEQLSIESQPQFKFSSSIDNLLCMPEFKDYDFSVGNYVLLEYYDDYYIQLRLDSVQLNPFAPENAISVSYTNYVKSNSKRNDLTYILDENSGSSSGSSGSGGGSGSGAFGESDKIDVTISNTMLAKLLNTEMFGSRVSNIILDTMKLNNLNAKHATFGSLASGTTTIDGACIETGSIISTGFNKNSSCKYNGTVTNVTYNGEVIGKKYSLDGTVGSVINLYDGTFNFGGGKLVYNGSTLALKGSFEAGSDSQTKINADGSLSLGGGNITYNTTNGLVVNGSITATGGYISGWTIAQNRFYDNNTESYISGINQYGYGMAFFAGTTRSDLAGNNAKFKVDHGGNLTATSATITGSITATGGTISGNLTISGSLIHGSNKYSVTTRGVQSDTSYGVFYVTEYTDTSRTSVSSYPFRVNGDGSFSATKATITGNITANNITVKDTLRMYDSAEGYSANVGVFTYTGGSLDILRTVNFEKSWYSLSGYIYCYYSDTNSADVIGCATTDVSGSTYSSDAILGTNATFFDRGTAKNWNTVSDRKAKNHIKYLSDEEYLEDFFMALKPVEFTFKDGHRTHLGMYAQDVAQTAKSTIGELGLYDASVIHNGVLGETDGEKEEYYDENTPDENLVWSLRYTEFIAPTIVMLQKAINKINLLEERIQELEGE